MAHIFGSIWDRSNRNALNILSKSVEQQGKSIQDLVAEGQLTEEQYAELIKMVNGLLSSGEVSLNDLSQSLREEIALLQEGKDAVELAILALDAKIEGKELPEPVLIENLWDKEDTVLGTLNEQSGNVTAHATNLTLNYTEIVSGEPYTLSWSYTSKVVFFDEDRNVVEGHGWMTGSVESPKTFIPPETAKYVRMTIDYRAADITTFNVGTEVWTPEEDGNVWDSSFWEGIPTPPLRENSVRTKHLADRQVTEDKIDQELLNLIKSSSKTVTKPYPQKLHFKEIGSGWSEVNHLSRDGEVVYFKRGRVIEQSTDDGLTIDRIGAIDEAPSIQAIRDLDDGELLVSTTRDEDIDLKSKVFKSVGYDRNNPADTQFVEVLEAISKQANIYSSWGLEAHGNIVLASEYGLRGEDGARHVYLSTDYGNEGTWEMIFDQKTTTENIEGAPTWTTTAHLHTVHYDRYWDRIWLAVGDAPNSATYYSDDMGGEWKHVPDSGIVQYTGIVSFPDGVIFGSDRAPNGLHVWKRTESKTDNVEIETLKTINDETVITHVFQRAFRRYAEKDEVALFPATRVSAFSGVYSSVIMGFTGIGNPHLLYELPFNGLGFYIAVGVTAKGNILTSYHNGTNQSILRAKAPLWE